MPAVASAPLSIAGCFGDDIDHSVDGVRSPQRGTRTPDYLDTLDVSEQKILLIPEHSRIDWRIHSPSIHQDEQLVAAAVVESGELDSPLTPCT